MVITQTISNLPFFVVAGDVGRPSPPRRQSHDEDRKGRPRASWPLPPVRISNAHPYLARTASFPLAELVREEV